MATTTTALPLRTAMESRDVRAVVESFTPDAVFHSPLTSKINFRGRDQIGRLTEVIFEVFEDFHYVDEVRAAETGFLVAEARVGGTDIEMVDHLRLTSDGAVDECTVFMRPLPAAAVALRMIGSGLGRRRSATRGVVISGLARPLGLITHTADGIGVALLRPCLQ